MASLSNLSAQLTNPTAPKSRTAAARTTYQWRIEWGPTGGSNEVRVYLDGRVIIRQDYRRSYSPSIHYIELGVEERAESIVGVVYRNVSIGRR